MTNNQRVNVEELEVVESTSSGSVDGLSHDEKKAKESSASYRKLQSRLKLACKDMLS